MKTLFKFAFVAAIVAVVGYNVYKSQSVMNGMSEFALANVEALASVENTTDCGNVTFIPNEALRSAACWNGGTHLKCKNEDGVCCEPSKQTDCDGLI